MKKRITILKQDYKSITGKAAMTDDLKALAMGCCQGHWQREQVTWLVDGYALRSPFMAVVGKAREYSDCYERSWRNLLTRLAGKGFWLTRYAGPRGGEYLAHYTLHHPRETGAITAREFLRHIGWDKSLEEGLALLGQWLERGTGFFVAFPDADIDTESVDADAFLQRAAQPAPVDSGPALEDIQAGIRG